MLNGKIRTFIMLIICTGLLTGIVSQPSLAAAGTQTYSLQLDGYKRTYTVYEPPGFNNKQPTAVVIMLHGIGGTGQGVIAETGWDRLADKEGFLAVFPDALRVNQAAEPNLLTNPQMWHDGSNRDRGLLQNANDTKFLSLMLDNLAKKYTLDKNAVFITGFSSGASLAFRAAEELPGRFAAIAPVSGHYWGQAPKAKQQIPVPTIIIVGAADPINPFDGGTVRLPWGTFEHPPYMESINRWVKTIDPNARLQPMQGMPGVASYRVAGKTFDLCRVYVVEGLGHMWPGGTAIYPESFIGKDPGTLDATAVIWHYFAEVRRETARRPADAN